MRHLPLLALLPIVLFACATPQQACKAGVARQIADIDAQIADTRENLDRGYAYLPSNTRFGVRFCAVPGGNMVMCLGQDARPAFSRVNIEPSAEQAKLDALLLRRSELALQSSQCEAEFPQA